MATSGNGILEAQSEFLVDRNTSLLAEVEALYADLRALENRVLAVKSKVIETADMVVFQQIHLAVEEEDESERRRGVKAVRRRTVEMEAAKRLAAEANDAIVAARRALSSLSCQTFTEE